MADPVSNLALYLWSHGGEIWINVIAILISAAVGWTIYSLLRRIAKKAEDTLERIPERLSRRSCPECLGKKFVDCLECRGKGSNTKTVRKDVVCPACKGTKQVEVNCPTCAGARTVSRRLSFTPLGISAETRFSIIPFGHYEYVTVRIKNSDAAPGTYKVRATIGDSGSSSSQLSQGLGAGATGVYHFEFKVRGARSYPAQFEVEPPSVVEECRRCSAKGAVSVACPDCAGTGSIPQTTEVAEACLACDSKGNRQCPECKGEGRIPGLFG